MNHPAARAVALVCHGNAALRGADPGAFFPGNSACRFAEWVRFTRPRGPLPGLFGERPVAGNPQEWFGVLRGRSVERLRLAALPPRPGDLLALTGDGGIWRILALGPGGSCEGWRGREEVGDREAPDRRIWRVTYRSAGSCRLPPAAPSVEEAGARLEESLRRMAAFSSRHAGGAFLGAFERALTTLRTGERHGYHRDLAPPGILPEAAEVLLDACAAESAWVFGGMGWWNDLSFPGEAGTEYDRLTEAHFRAVCGAMEAAADASAGS